MNEAEEFNQILESLSELPISHKDVQRYLRLGIYAELRKRRNQYRQWVKQGQAHKIPDKRARDIFVDTESRIRKAEMESVGSFCTDIMGIVDDFSKKLEHTLLMKWMVGSTPLGLSTPEYLLSAAFDEDERAEGHMNNAKFYRELARISQPKMPIMMSVSPEKAEQIRASIFDTEILENAA